MKLQKYERSIPSRAEFRPALFHQDLSAKLGGVDGSGFAKVVYEMSCVQLRAIVLGHGRYPLESDGRSAELPEMSELREEVVASDVQEDGLKYRNQK